MQPHHQRRVDVIRQIVEAFDGDQVTLDSEANVAFRPTKRPRLIGRAE